MRSENSTYKPIRLIISGGGTGGHLFPAIAIAQRIRELSPESHIHFVGALGKLEMDKVPQYDFTIDGLWISGLYRGEFKRNLNLPFKLISSLWNSARILRKHEPQVAVGVGGYASGPLLYLASKKGIPCLLQEQNSFPGITNKLLARAAAKICVAFPGMDRYFPKEKLILSGNPIRTNIKLSDKAEAKRKLGFQTDKPVILSLGGSLGAKSINDCLRSQAQSIREHDLQLFWQCGKLYEESLRQELGKTLEEDWIQLSAFIEDMSLAYSAADLIISRAGALTISELCYLGLPALLVPSPNVAEDHQRKNAEVLTTSNAARMVLDKEVGDRMLSTAIDLVKSEDGLQDLAANAKKMGKPEATDTIVNEIFKLANE